MTSPIAAFTLGRLPPMPPLPVSPPAGLPAPLAPYAADTFGLSKLILQHPGQILGASPGGPSPLANNPNDPFEPLGLITSGPLAGQRTDMSYARSCHILSPAEAAPYDPKPGEILVANVHQGAHWYIARIPADAVQDVIVQDETIPGGLGHNQLRFVMKPDKAVELIPQVKGDNTPPITARDFIFSGEGLMPGTGDGEFNLTTGVLELGNVAYTFVTTPHKVGIMTKHGLLDRVDQFRLQLSDQTKQRLLLTALRMGNQAGMGREFNMMHRNCASVLLDVLDSSIPYDWLHAPLAHVRPIDIPVMMPQYLFQRGLIGPGLNTAMPTLGKELGLPEAS